AEDGIRYGHVTGVQTCALPIYSQARRRRRGRGGWGRGGQNHSGALLTRSNGLVPARREARRRRRRAVRRSPRLVDRAGRLLVPRSEERRVGKEASSRGATSASA